MVYYIINKITGLTDLIHKDIFITGRRGELKKQSGRIQGYKTKKQQ